jgi:cytoskeleton protein RodZ
MASVGSHLRELRARRGVPLDEIARTTRVARRYLEALEADAFEALPSPVFTRGFIRAYCQALAESPDEALACYDARDGRVPPAVARPLVTARAGEADSRTRGTVLVSLVLVVVLGMALVTVALLLRPRERSEPVVAEAGREPSPTPVPTVSPAPPSPEPVTSRPAPASSPLPPVPPAATMRPPGPAPTMALAPVPPTVAPALPPVAAAPPPAAPAQPAAAPAPPAGTTGEPAAAPPAPPALNLDTLAGGLTSPYRLVARTYEPTWIRVRTEDGRSSEETVPAGEVREWVSDRPFVLTVGNAGGVSLELNGRTLPPLGARGAVIPRLVLPPP